MPPHPPCVRRMGGRALEPVRGPRRKAPEAPQQTHNAHHRACDRGPDDELRPSLAVTPDRRQVNPVQDGAGVGPPPRCGGRLQEHLTRRRRDVDVAVVRIAKSQAMHRQLPVDLERPLIGSLEQSLVPDAGRVFRCECARFAECLVGTERRHGSSIIGEERTDRAVFAYPEHGPTVHCAELKTFRTAGRIHDNSGSHRRAREIQHRPSRQPFGRRQAGHAGVHQHHARYEPAEEQRTEHDAEPSMRVDNDSAYHRTEPGIGHAAFRRLSISAVDRATSPRSTWSPVPAAAARGRRTRRSRYLRSSSSRR